MVILGGLAIDGDFGLGMANVSGNVMPMTAGILLIAAMIPSSVFRRQKEVFASSA